MGEVICTVIYKEREKIDLVLPDSVPVLKLAESIARIVKLPEGESIFYELSLAQEGREGVRFTGTRGLREFSVTNGTVLKLSGQKVNDQAGAYFIDALEVRHRLMDKMLIGRKTRKISVEFDLTGLDEHKVISREHAVVTRLPSGYVIRDLDSRNGTYVNQFRLQQGQSYSLRPGDEVCFGSLEKGVKVIFQTIQTK